jgi:hypothetical protein
MSDAGEPLVAVPAPTPRAPEPVEAPAVRAAPVRTPSGALFDTGMGGGMGPPSPVGLIGHLARCSVEDRKAGIDDLNARAGNRCVARMIRDSGNAALMPAAVRDTPRSAPGTLTPSAPVMDEPAVSDASTVGQMLAIQGPIGNSAVARMLHRQPATAEARPASPISADNLEQMRADVDFITAGLKQQVLEAAEEQAMLERVRAWASWDESHAASGKQGTPFLDKFLVLLKTRTFSRSTARMLWGLAGEEWMNAYDGLFYELEDARQEALRAIVTKSEKQGTAGPETEQMESVYSYVGKRVGMGSWGIIKQMGLAVMSVADALIWLEWRREGRPGDPPQLSPAVAKSFDEAAGVLADIANSGATPKEIEEEKKALMEEYAFGDRWGKIVGILMSAGMGSGGQAVKAISAAAGVAQGAQGVEASAKKIAARIEAIRKKNPKATWADFLADDEVRLEIGNGLAALIGLVGSLAGDEGAVAEFLKRNHLLVSATVLTPMLKKAWMDHNDPALALDPTKRKHVLEEDVATIVGTIASMVGSHVDAKRAQEKAAAEAKAKGEAAAAQAQPEVAEVEAPAETAAPVDAEEPTGPAMSPTDEDGPGRLPEEEGSAGTVASPDEMPNVLLVDVTPSQLESVLVALEASTPTGKEIARRVRSGELQLTLDAGRVTEGAVGLAVHNEVHVSWDGSVQDVAATLIHEAVHQGDPGLAGGAPRSEVEATARVAEFEYREHAGLPPRDSVEAIYRAVLQQGIEQGTPLPETQARARQAMIDMMRTDAKRFGVEPAGGGGEQDPGASSSPAMSADPEGRARSLENRLEALESHPNADAMRDTLERAQALIAAGREPEADRLLSQLDRDVRTAENTIEQSGLESNFSDEEPTALSRTVEYTPSEGVPVQLDATSPLATDQTGQILLEHVEQAVARFEAEGLTDRQTEALRRLEAGGDRSALYDAFRGSRIDEFAKQSALQDPRLSEIYVTALRERGADFLDARTGQWYDITTTGAWQDHLDRYGVDPGGWRLPTEPQ